MTHNFYKNLRTICLLLFIGFSSLAQTPLSSPIHLGKVNDLITALGKSGPNLKSASAAALKHKISKTEEIVPQVNLVRPQSFSKIFIGNIKAKASSTFFIKVENGDISGNIILNKEKKAYRYFSKAGDAFIEEVDINTVVCVEYAQYSNVAAENSTASASSYPTHLESLPGAEAVVLLDFDGQYVEGTRWNSGQPINASPSGISSGDVDLIYQIVSEDFDPFNINITTNESVYFAAPSNKRMRVIFTPTRTAAPGSGGVAYINSFTWGDDTPCWVFTLSGKAGGETASHEIGHTMGLSHDGQLTTSTNPPQEYYSGNDNWAPIMGLATSQQSVQWSKGEYPNANNTQDDIAIITTRNGFSFKQDEGQEALAITGAGYVSGHGNIQTSSDSDTYIFRSDGDTVNINANTVAPYTNLDVKLTIKDLYDNVIVSNESPGMGAELRAYLPPNAYKLVVEGVKGTLGAQSDYGSIGFFALGGKFTPLGKTNLLKYKPVVTSSNYTSSHDGSKAVDGDLTTRWGSQDSDNQWIMVDLLGNYKINRVKIKWEPAYGRDFSIQTSSNGSTWVDIHTVTGNTSHNNDFTSLNGIGRYLRINCTKRATAYGYSIFELEAYGSPANSSPVVNLESPERNSKFNTPATINLKAVAADNDGTIAKVEFYNGNTLLGTDTQAPYTFSWNVTLVGTYQVSAKAYDNLGATHTSPKIPITVVHDNIALNKPVTATSSINDNYASKANDGQLNTEWATTTANTQSITIDLNTAYNVFRMELNWGASYAADYQIMASFDNRNWRAIKSVVNNISINNVHSNSLAARYIRINCTRRGPGTNYVLKEVLVNGTKINNNAPIVNITSPSADGQYFTASPTNITLAASASDSDGQISAVEFYTSGTMIGRDSIAPYSLTTEIYNGKHSFYAIAYDNYGAITTSTVREVIVESNNLAYQKAITTSSYKDINSLGSYAVDANLSTSWQSAPTSSGPQWLTANLGAIFNIYMVKILWANNLYASNIELRLSDDNVNWRTVRTISGNTNQETTFMYFAENTRYVRIYCASPGANGGYAIKDLIVYGSSQSGAMSSARLINAEETTVFPNPSDQWIEITYPSSYVQQAIISLIDPFAKSTIDMEYELVEGESRIRLNVEKLKDGIYFLQIRTGETRINKKIQIKH